MTLLLTLATTGLLTGCGGPSTGFSAGTNANTNQAGSGSMELIPADGLVWDDLVPGFPCSEYVRLDSVGLEELNIDKVDVVDSGGGVFTLPEPVSGISINPGDSFEFTVQATLGSLETATGELRIKSNDEETVDLRLPMTANPVDSWDTGDTGEPPC